MPRLVSVGNVIVDIVMRVLALPEPGGDVIASSSDLAAGGGLNTLVAARRDGAEVVFAGQYGTGPFGDIVRTALAAADIRVVQSGLAEYDSGYCIAIVDASTERTFLTAVGAEARLTRSDLDRIALEPDDIVFVSGYGLAHPGNARAIVGWLEQLPRETRVVFDPSPLVDTLAADALDAVIARADVTSANAREARLLAGPTRPLDEAAGLLARRSRRIVIVRDGAAGCWVAGHGGPVTLVPGFPVEAVDTNGAGDAHDGVLVAALTRGDDILEAARRANAAAALAVTRRGPATGPTGAQIDQLMRDA